MKKKNTILKGSYIANLFTSDVYNYKYIYSI